MDSIKKGVIILAVTCNLDCSKDLDIVFRGATPKFNFNVCLDTDIIDLDNSHIMFTSGAGKVDKSGTDIVVEQQGVLSCSLTQEETMSFTANQVNIQILITTKNGQKPVSIIWAIPVSNTLRGDDKW